MGGVSVFLPPASDSHGLGADGMQEDIRIILVRAKYPMSSSRQLAYLALVCSRGVQTVERETGASRLYCGVRECSCS